MTQKLNTVMLIDDDEPTNFLSKMLIEEAHCADHIQIAESGKLALDYLSRSNKSPDLIFLDINMPAMNGWEFLDKYRELEKAKQGKIVIIMLTTSLNPDDKVKAGQMPEIAGFENKPLSPELIDRVLKKYFANDILNPVNVAPAA
ncbi:MAG: response regulator [Ferruginibacter sp.]